MTSSILGAQLVTTSALISKKAELNTQIDDLRKAFQIAADFKFDFLELSESSFIKQWPASSQCPPIHTLFFKIYPSMLNKEQMITVIEDVPVLVAKVTGDTLLYFIQAKDICNDSKYPSWRSAFVQWGQGPKQQLRMVQAGYLDNTAEAIQRLFKGDSVELTFCDTLERREWSFKKYVKLLF